MDQQCSNPKSTEIYKFVLPILLFVFIEVQIITYQEMESIPYIGATVITLKGLIAEYGEKTRKFCGHIQFDNN
jgi:hypothetical protein